MKSRKTSYYLAILLSALAGVAAIQGALGAMHGQTSTQGYDTAAGNETSVTAADNETTTADNMTATAEDNATSTVNATGTSNATGNGNETTLAEANETAVAGENVTVTVTPFAQSPGKSALVQAEGLDPDANATITVDGELAANTETDGNGTLLYALGVPSEPITKMTIRVDNDTGEETITNETHAWEGTVKVVVEDQAGNRGSGELTLLAPVDESNQTSTAGANITRETLDRFLD